MVPAVPPPCDAKTAGCNVFLSGIPRGVKQNQLRTWFEEHYGDIRHVRFIFDRRTQQHRGTGFALFFSVDTAERVVRDHGARGINWQGRCTIKVGARSQNAGDDDDDQPPCLLTEFDDDGSEADGSDSAGLTDVESSTTTPTAATPGEPQALAPVVPVAMPVRAVAASVPPPVVIPAAVARAVPTAGVPLPAVQVPVAQPSYAVAFSPVTTCAPAAAVQMVPAYYCQHPLATAGPVRVL
eukprot:TRINITY_DN10624_c0_g1_i1.p1 TRINITY_DN10624_c0_g1~~TRINITY_DN10624_c0_g1_i1.p1  ORF type:complete len:239 (+),score=52.21 TRINITY_DN10624_c0_g1_i1:87-803(+)